MIRLATLRAGCTRLWYGPTDALALDAFRQVLTLGLVLATLGWYPYADEWLTPGGFRPSPESDPIVAPLAPLLPAWAVTPFFVAYFAAMLAVLFDRGRRAGTCALVAALVYLHLADPLGWSPAHALALLGFSVLALAPPPGPAGELVAWPRRILQAALLLIFAGAGLDLLRGDWLWDGEVLQLRVAGEGRGGASAWLLANLPAWSWPVLQRLILSYLLLAPALLIPRRIRPLGVGLGAGLLLALALAYPPALHTGVLTLAFLLLFLPLPLLRRVLAPLSGAPARVDVAPAPPDTAGPWKSSSSK